MKTTAEKSNDTSAHKSSGTSRRATSNQNKSLDQSSQLKKLFEEELKDIYWAEKALTKAIPKMIKQATSEELKSALENHLQETENQVTRAEQVFSTLGMEPKAKKCDAMAGLIKEAEEIMEECDEGVMRDAGIISAAQKVEHYEIATYGTLRQFAETLGFEDAVSLLDATLEEEKAADGKLSEVAEGAINIEAAETPTE